MGKWAPVSIGQSASDESDSPLTAKDLDKLEAIIALADELKSEIKATNSFKISGYPTAKNAAKAELKRRIDRKKIFHKYEIFSDPGWEILLELYIADCNNTRMAISSIGLETNIPPSTSLRWVKLLEEFGLIVRSADEFDRRRSWLSLTDDAKKMLDLHFSH